MTQMLDSPREPAPSIPRRCAGVVAGLIASLTIAVAPSANAQSPAEIEARVAAAAEVLETSGFEAFCAAVSDPTGPYLVDDAYVFALTLDGFLVCHPRPATLNVPTGAPSAVPRMIANAEAAAPSGAWTAYPWPHPDTLEIGEKETYCQISGPLIVCAGDFFNEATS